MQHVHLKSTNLFLYKPCWKSFVFMHLNFKVRHVASLLWELDHNKTNNVNRNHVYYNLQRNLSLCKALSQCHQKAWWRFFLRVWGIRYKVWKAKWDNTMKRNQTGISRQYKFIQECRTGNLAAPSHTSDCYKMKIDMTENSTKHCLMWLFFWKSVIILKDRTVYSQKHIFIKIG